MDRVYVFEKHAGDAGGPVISRRFEWVAEGVEPQIDSPDLQNVPHRGSGLRRGEDVLAENGLICGPVEDRLRLEVWDTGIGIREEFLPHLFEGFRQASSGCDRSHEGTGLGLAISHHLVRRMGGSIGVESRTAEGSTFTVSLPCRPAAGSRDGGGVGSEGIVGRG